MARETAIVAVAGCSCSGKSTLARALARQLRATILPIDGYYRDLSHLTLEERERVNFDSPDAIEHELLADHLRRLRSSEPVERPIYDFTTHTRRNETRCVKPGRYLVLEGLFALHWEDIREFTRLKVYVDLDDDTCFRRRLERDTQYRGRTPESVRAQYDATVRPMAERYVVPSRRFAEAVVLGDESVKKAAARVIAHLRGESAGV